MSTAVFDVATSLQERINELSRLLDLADENASSSEAVYNTLCRACCVLAASHLEGFLKDFSRSIIYDLNFHLKTFAKMPDAMKRTFCRKIVFFEGVPEPDLNNRTNQLMAFLNNNSVSLDMSAFQYKETLNKNPRGDVIVSALEKLGIPAVFEVFTGGPLDNVFSNDSRAIYKINRDMRRFRGNLFSFPYRSIKSNYGFGVKPKSVNKSMPTLWHGYVDEVMQRRHNIVHGDTMSNETTSLELRQDVEKLSVLMHAVIYASTMFLMGKI